MLKLFQSKIVAFVGIIALFFISMSLGKEVYRKYQIQKEINAMQEEIKKLEGNNADLNKMLEYFKSEAFLETEARKKLNLQKQDEKVVIFTDKVDKKTVERAVENTNNLEASVPEKTEYSNAEKWWGYFFNQR